MNDFGTVPLTWRKSTHSSPQHSDCVELADLGVAIAVRDSKDPEGPKLAIASADWQALTAAIRRRSHA
ncbi:DUF397 domain-containing protein [Actinomadura gamaensis]|uniref:DUF397 domain-containing protein n=1 Tax=Actinomadura gamaensis TaxID=1763541 RepID=A0ABV9U7A3_9ACTN